MFEESEIQRKINNLFREAGKEEELAENFFSEDDKMSLEEISDEEKSEIENYVKAVEANKVKPPKKVWRWKFFGRLILKGILTAIDFVLLTSIFYLLIPIIFAYSFSITQSIALSVVLYILKRWWK